MKKKYCKKKKMYENCFSDWLLTESDLLLIYTSSAVTVFFVLHFVSVMPKLLCWKHLKN